MRYLKKTSLVLSLLVCLAMLAAAAAEPTLSARVEGGALDVRWDAGCAGSCTLTVYRDDWPICVREVNAGDDGIRIPLSDPAGRYTVRLKTANGCLTTSAGGKAGAQPAPTTTARPTAALTARPTAAPTAKPTAVPTAKPTAAPRTGASRTDLASRVVEQVNAERAKQGLSPLRVNAELTRAACVRAGEIVQRFSHTRPDGSAWNTVSGAAYGENIAMGQNSVDKVMAAWMTSQGHRENILRASYGSIGVCAYAYDGVLYWVQLFGK